MDNRGASEVLSFALVFAVVVGSVAVVSVSGLQSLQSARDAEQINNAERAFDVLSDNMADIHRRGAPSRATEVSLGDAELYTGDNVTMNVTARDGSGDRLNPIERSVRPIVYRSNDGRSLVYEGGAVFRVERDGGLMIEEPPFVVGDGSSPRAMLPVVATQSAHVESAGGSTSLVRTNERSTDVAMSETGLSALYVNISSERNALWREYLDGSGFTCESPTTVNGEEYVECELSNPDIVHVTVYDVGVTIEQ